MQYFSDCLLLFKVLLKHGWLILNGDNKCSQKFRLAKCMLQEHHIYV